MALSLNLDSLSIEQVIEALEDAVFRHMGPALSQDHRRVCRRCACLWLLRDSFFEHTRASVHEKEHEAMRNEQTQLEIDNYTTVYAYRKNKITDNLITMRAVFTAHLQAAEPQTWDTSYAKALENVSNHLDDALWILLSFKP